MVGGLGVGVAWLAENKSTQSSFAMAWTEIGIAQNLGRVEVCQALFSLSYLLIGSFIAYA